MINSDHQQKPVHKLRKHFISKKWLIISIIVFLFIVGSLSVWVFFTRNSLNVTDSNIKALDLTAAKANEVTKKVEAIVTNKGPQAGQDYLNTELVKTSNPKEQAQLYINKSALASSAMGGSDGIHALEYAQKAEDLSPDAETALSVALLEEGQGNIPVAIKYYKLYLERSPKNSQSIEPSEDDYDFYVARVARLEKGTK